MKKLFLVLALAFIFRLILFPIAHHGDLNNNLTWGKAAVENGLRDFYEGGKWSYSSPNQPPLTILTFAGTGYVWRRVANLLSGTSLIWWWQDKGIDLMVKLPGIIADLVIAWLIFKYTQKLFLSAIWLFNPITWYNSAVWGQTDSIVNLLFFGGTLFLIRKDLIKAFVFFVLSLLFKGSLALFLPLVIVYAVWQKHPFKKWLMAAGYSLLVVILATVWFHPRVDLFVWLFKLYLNRIFPGEIGFLTANAFNFWWLVNPGKVLDTTIYLGLPARIWGMTMTISGLVIVIFWLKKKLTEKRLFISLCFLSLISFIFMTRIHERYLYPFFLPATILLVAIPGMVIPYLILSITHLFNLYHLFWAPGIPILVQFYRFSWFPQVLSVINLISFVFLLRLLKRGKL